MTNQQRPFVLLSTLCIIETFLVLCFPRFFPAILGASIVVSVIAFIILFRRKRYISGCVATLILLFSCINPYRLYVSNELYCERFCEKQSANKDAVYTAEVTKFSDYGSYCVTFARLKTADGKKVEKSPSVRIGSYANTHLWEGDTITFKGIPSKLSDIEETDFDTSTYLRGKNTFIDFESATIISSAPAEKESPFNKIREYARKTIYHYLTENFNFGPPSVAFAMLSGDKEFISSDTTLAFRDSGISHVLCVSGLHLSIVVTALFVFLSWLTVGKKTKCVIIMAFCIVFCAFTGFSLSTLRACIMTCLTYIAAIVGKKTDAYSCLFFAALIICTFSPYSVFDLSAILSFLATFGIILIADVIPDIEFKSVIATLLQDFIDSIILGMGAFVFTVPVCSYFFGTITIYSIIATVLASPFCAILLTGLLCLIILSPLSFITTFDIMILEVIGTACRMSAEAIIKIADFFCSSRFASIPSLFTDIYIVLFIGLLIIISVFVAIGRKRLCFFGAALILLAGLVFSFTSLYCAVNKDAEYTVSYYRKNENNRQLAVKLGTGGYLIVHADDEISLDSKKAVFDTKERRNYFLIVPDRIIVPELLVESMLDFDKEYGIRKIFIPNTQKGAKLASDLKNLGIRCHIMPEKAVYNDITVEFISQPDYYRITVYDDETRTEVVYGEYYSRDFFTGNADICAYFTRKTINQFNYEKHEAPDCRVFYTRMARDEEHEGIENTNSKTDFYIKE